MTLSEKILSALNDADKYPSQYYSIEDRNGCVCKIRVSSHSANRTNNGDTKTLSFVTNRINQGYQSMINEWAVDVESGLTDTFQSITEVLEWNDIDDM